MIPWRDDGKTAFLLFAALGFGAATLCLFIHPSICSLPFLVTHGGCALFLAYEALATMVNKTCIAMTPTSLDVSHAPLDRGTSSTISTNQIAAIAWRCLRDGDGVVGHTLAARCVDGTRRDIWVPVKDAEQARFVAEAIALYYGLPCIEESG